MEHAFQIVVLGCTGGPKEGNLSGYLFAPLKIPAWFALDAGTLLQGIESALSKGSLDTVTFTDPKITPAGEMLSKHVRGFLISHAHLDHIAGLVLNSQVDQPKWILGIDPTIDNIRDHIFNGRIWPNYGSEGAEPILDRYKYVRAPLHRQIPIPESPLTVECFLLSHPRGYPSTAFLIEFEDEYLLYFGDTSSDFLEVEKHLARIWERIAPLIREKRLRAMMLECSFGEKEEDLAIFGHLDTRLMLKELHVLQDKFGAPLEGLKVIVTHRKENLSQGKDPKKVIEEELLAGNDLGIEFLFPTQGARFLV